MKIKRWWLVYYKQRPLGAERWTEANAVTDQHPADFLLRLQEMFTDHESLVMWAVQINNEDTAARLIGRL